MDGWPFICLPYILYITFSQDIFPCPIFCSVGELTDNIPLNFDGVLTTVRDQVVTGYKSFVQNVVIDGELHVDRYVNGIDVIELLTDTVSTKLWLEGCLIMYL